MVSILLFFALNVLTIGKASNEIDDSGLSSHININHNKINQINQINNDHKNNNNTNLIEYGYNIIIFPGTTPSINHTAPLLLRKRRQSNYWTNQQVKKQRQWRRKQRDNNRNRYRTNQGYRGQFNGYQSAGRRYGRRQGVYNGPDQEHKGAQQQTIYHDNNIGYNPQQQQQKNRRSRPLGGWTPWAQWTKCSRTCGFGSQTRRRFCANAQLGTTLCQGSTTQSQVCGNGEECVAIFQWSTWNKWTACTQSCGSGTTFRSRRCYNVAKSIASDSDKACVGPNTEQAQCNTQLCSVNMANDNPTALKMSQSCGTIPMKNKFPIDGVNPQKSPVNLRITGGQIAKMGDFPWQVSLQRKTCKKNLRPGYNFKEQCTWKHMCGAAILHSKWVITAAHCIAEAGYRTDYERPGDDWALVVGMDKLNDGSSGSDGKRYYIDKIVQHPDYEFQYITVSDVSLLKVRGDILINDRAQPICLPNGVEPKPADMCQISGWGYGDHAGKGSEVLSPDLRQASIPMVNFQTCQKIGIWYKLLHEKVHMCGGDRFKGGVDSCGGDSGGPLTCRRPDGTYYLAGITSFGFSDCGQQGHVGIYARMISFEQWVTNTIHAKDDSPKYTASKYGNGGYHYYQNYRTQHKG